MKHNRVYLFLVLILIGLSSKAIDFTRVNIAWQYDPLAEIEARHRVVQKGDSLTVFLRIRTDSLQMWSYEFLIQPRYDSESHRTFTDFNVDTLSINNDRAIVRLKFSKPAEDLLILKIFKSDTFLYYDILLKNGVLPFPSIYPMSQEGLPIFHNYIGSSTVTWTGSEEFYIQKYREDFPFADPPMADMKPLAPSILPDTAFQYFNEPLEDEYFYVIRMDSNATQGVTFVKSTPYYPEFKKLNELATSMYYILNEPERKAMENSRDLKKSFDQFWIKTFTTKFRARNAIRNYFNWVKQANRFFTDFKQGWKTDRGMLFIVYGVPDEVYRGGNQEEWYYDNGPSFEFTVISTFFSPRTYALRRRIDFEDSWFEYIAAIRRGRE